MVQLQHSSAAVRRIAGRIVRWHAGIARSVIRSLLLYSPIAHHYAHRDTWFRRRGKDCKKGPLRTRASIRLPRQSQRHGRPTGIIVLGGDRGVRNYFIARSTPRSRYSESARTSRAGFSPRSISESSSRTWAYSRGRTIPWMEVPRLGVKIDGRSVLSRPQRRRGLFVKERDADGAYAAHKRRRGVARQR